MNDHLIRSTATMLGSLLGYYAAKDQKRETLPVMMLGGFALGCIAELIIYKKGQAK